MLGTQNIFKAIAAKDFSAVEQFVKQGGDLEKESTVKQKYALRLFNLSADVLVSPLEYAGWWENSEPPDMGVWSVSNMIFDYLEKKIRNKYFPTSFEEKVSHFFSRIDANDYARNFHSVGFSLLHAAVSTGNIRLAEKAITVYRIDPNKVYYKVFIDDAIRKQKYYLCVTPLTLAFLVNIPNKKEMARFLIRNKAEHCVEFSDRSHSFPLRALSPLSYAIIQNDINLVKFLIEELNAPIEGRDHLNYTPLMQAARSNTPEIAQLLIEKGARVQAKGDERYLYFSEQSTQEIQRTAGGHTVFHIAACFGSIETMKVLLNTPVDLNHIDKDGYAALAYAVTWEHKEISELLIRAGANPYAGTEIRSGAQGYGQSALEAAVLEKRVGFIHLFYSEKCDHIKEIPALLFDKKLKEEDDDVNEGDAEAVNKFFHEQTDKLRLWRACRIGDFTELRRLLEGDRALHVSLLDFDTQGNTALHLACIHHQWKAAQFLLSKNESILDALNEIGETPLIALLKTAHPCTHTLSVLLSKRPDLEIADKDGMTALMHAAVHADPASFELLWKRVTRQTEFSGHEGEALFLLAIKSNKLSAVTEAIQKGVNIHCLDEQEQDGLMLAASHPDCKIAKLLIEKGVKIEGTSQHGTAFDHALRAKNVPLCLILMSARILFLSANSQLNCEGAALRFLFEQINKVDVRDRYGHILLSLAIGQGNTALATMLGTSINQEEDEGSLPIKKKKGTLYCFNDVLAGKEQLLSAANPAQKRVIKRILSIYEQALLPDPVCAQGKAITPLNTLFKAKNTPSASNVNHPESSPSASSSGARKRKTIGRTSCH